MVWCRLSSLVHLKYLSTNTACPRETVSATAANRQEQDAHRMDLLQQSFFEADDITTLTAVEIMDSLKTETALPFGFTFTVIESQLVIYWLQVRCNIPIIRGCIVVDEDHTVAVSLDATLVPSSKLGNLLQHGTVQRMSELVNLKALVKSWCEDEQSRSVKLCVDMAIVNLENALESIEYSECDEYRKKTSFIIEQLKLLPKHKYARHSSPQLTIMSYRLYATSSAAYRSLLGENILCIPSTSTLKKVSRRLNSTTGLEQHGVSEIMSREVE